MVSLRIADVKKRGFSRRLFLKSLLGAGVGIPGAASLLAACGSSSSPSTATSESTSSAKSATSSTTSASTSSASSATSASASSGTATSAQSSNASNPRNKQIVVGLFLEPNSLDPALSTYVPGTRVLRNIVETLVELDPEAQPRPRLATKWETSPDGKTWTWTLRDGINFQDGTPFNADAVKFTFDRIANPNTNSQSGLSDIGPYKSTEVVDPHTVKMTFTGVYAPLLNNLADIAVAIVSPSALQKSGTGFGQHPVGTGPYLFKEWAKGDHITITRWDQYVQTSTLFGHKGPPYLETLVFRIIPEDGTRLDTLKNGEIDFMMNVPGLDFPQVKSDPRFQVFQEKFAGDPTMFLINRDILPTSDLAVAQAVEFAVDKSVITKIGTNSTSPPAHGPLKASDWAYNPKVETLYQYDPSKAKDLLDKAGWKPGSDGLRSKDGHPGTLVCNVKADPITISMLGAIGGMLKAVGLSLKVNTMALPASEELAKHDKNNLTFMDWRGTDPDILTVHFASENIGGWNMGYFKNAQVDQLLKQGRETLDRNQRRTIYDKIQMIIMEQAATLPLFDAVELDAAVKELEGVTYDATHYYVNWYDVSFKA